MKTYDLPKIFNVSTPPELLIPLQIILEMDIQNEIKQGHKVKILNGCFEGYCKDCGKSQENRCRDYYEKRNKEIMEWDKENKAPE